MKDSEWKENNRPFRKIETWDHFLERWEAIVTEQEAIGLIHAGTTIALPFETNSKAAEIEKRIGFYLSLTTNKNAEIAAVAQQIIIKYWLKATPFWEEYAPSHGRILAFLSYTNASGHSLWTSLLKPPYPRFISEYLFKVFGVWRSKQQDPKLHAIFQEMANLIVYSGLVWGLGYEFDRDFRGKDALPLIEKFLNARDYGREQGPGYVLMNLPAVEKKPIADLSSPAAQTLVEEIAAMARLKILYWMGEGVHEKYEKFKYSKGATQ